ncbi:L-aspartate oxidase [Aquipuribacter sp. SD81]|uniref:L-aspartate oxidase n=1 Tax=Aquipuribacter sp. SD81 TaxID=3127703 RepID=UPI003016B24C
MTRVPRHLVAPTTTDLPAAVVDDVVVVGSGIAGLTAALRLSRRGLGVTLVTKTEAASGSTRWAQGGIAAALADTDSPDAHYDDTVAAGGGLCDPAAVRVLVDDGPHRVRGLVRLGARFDLDPAGGLALTREGGHGADRIAHAGGDATGEEISRALVAALEGVVDDERVRLLEHTFAVDVLTDAAGAACGVLVAGAAGATRVLRARAVVLASGGIGQVYRSTTNPPEATGDGVAAALRAGAVLADLEFVQFHPTVLWLGGGARGQQPLVSEAVRGEGAVLLDEKGHRFMPDLDPRGELAPRDVVARGIVDRMQATGANHVLLDARHLGADFLARRFPSIVRRLAEHGFDLAADPVPVAPAQHYHSGGVRTDLDGRTSVPGLYAVGETACTGVHGANRLASNSLLEGLVFAARLADDIAARLGADELSPGAPVGRSGPAGLVPATVRSLVQRAASDGPGVLRDAHGLGRAARTLDDVVIDAHSHAGVSARPDRPEWEAANLHAVAVALTAAATVREESRGGHVRRDFPVPDPAWRRHLTVRARPDGTVDVETEEPL